MWQWDDLYLGVISGSQGLSWKGHTIATAKWQKMTAFQRLCLRLPAAVIRLQRYSCFLPSRLLLATPRPPGTNLELYVGSLCLH